MQHLLKPTFDWATPFIVRLFFKKFDPSTIPDLPINYNAEHLHTYFTYRPKRLLLSVIRTFIWSIVITLFIGFVSVICQLAMPVLMQFTLQNIGSPNYAGYYFATGLFLATLLFSFTYNHYWNFASTIGIQLKSILIYHTYQKLLKLSTRSRHSKSIGEMMNLISVDAQKIGDSFTMISFIVIGALQILGSLAFLFYLMSWTPLVGLGCAVLLFPLQMIMMRIYKKARHQVLFLFDERIRTLTEILQGIRVIKFFSWEHYFESVYSKVRLAEVKKILRIGVIRGFMSTLMRSFPIVIISSTIFAYYFTQGMFTATLIFTALSYFNIMRYPMGVLPMSINLLVESMVSIKRLQAFFDLQEEEEEHVQQLLNHEAKSIHLENDSEKKKMVSVTSATFEWEAHVTHAMNEHAMNNSLLVNTNKFTLSNINLELEKPSLTCVIGRVASGKSSLLSALIGDMVHVSGQLSLHGSVAYCSQQAFIQNASLKDNILFGKEYNEQFYKQVLHVCALEKDIESLANGDSTEIGEKGANISGGQKSRISLARAVYSNADIFILDDILSAVDANVSKWIFEKCIKQFLKEKTVLFATHQLQFLPHCDSIVMIENGTITEQGSFEKLIQVEHGHVNALVQEHSISSQEHNKKHHDLVDQGKKTQDAHHQQQQHIQNAEHLALISTEEMSHGALSLVTYARYAYNMGGVFILAYLCIIYFISQCAVIAPDAWLTVWSTNFFSNLTWQQYIGIFGGLDLLAIILVLMRDVSMTLSCIASSIRLHNAMLYRIMRAPISFFESTPIGRIVSRFSKDQEQLDYLMDSVLNIMNSSLQLLSILVIIAVSSYWFIIAIAALLVLFTILLHLYRCAALDLKRMENVSRSPILNLFNETLSGIPTIKAFKKQEQFLATCKRNIDRHLQYSFNWHGVQRWINLRVDFLCALLVFIVALVVASGSQIVSNSAFALNYAIQFTMAFSLFIRNFGDAEAQLSSVERISYYSSSKNVPNEDLDEEDSNENKSNISKANSWPANGTIEFNNFSMQYREDLKPVLKSISVVIENGSKVGVVGRSGSGKSSLLMALFRVPKITKGEIKIAGIDISTLKLAKLRSQIAVIPQDPTLFSGTIRSNLDPLNKYSDEFLWECLDKANLRQTITQCPDTLHCNVVENGDNFSIGQRQLICLARALTRKVKILVLDEATSSVDYETDQLIQKTIREAFADATVLSIAHRLKTVLNSDKIIVLDQGAVVEYDSVSNLMNKEHGVFKEMLQQQESQ